MQKIMMTHAGQRNKSNLKVQQNSKQTDEVGVVESRNKLHSLFKSETSLEPLELVILYV